MQIWNASNGIGGGFTTAGHIIQLGQILSDEKDSLEEDGIAVSKIPVMAWMIVIETKTPNIILFCPLNTYILKTLQ